MTDPALAQPDLVGAPLATEGTDVARSGHVLLQMRVDVRIILLAVVAVLASVTMLLWDSVILMPAVIGLLFSFALSPLVDWLIRQRIPRAVIATSLILGLLTIFGVFVQYGNDKTDYVKEAQAKAVSKEQVTPTMADKPVNENPERPHP